MEFIESEVQMDLFFQPMKLTRSSKELDFLVRRLWVLPQNMDKLIFEFCEFEKIGEKVFEGIDFPFLKELEFKNCSIKQIEHNAFFINSNELITLNFNNCKPLRFNDGFLSNGIANLIMSEVLLEKWYSDAFRHMNSSGNIVIKQR